LNLAWAETRLVAIATLASILAPAPGGACDVRPDKNLTGGAASIRTKERIAACQHAKENRGRVNRERQDEVLKRYGLGSIAISTVRSLARATRSAATSCLSRDIASATARRPSAPRRLPRVGQINDYADPRWIMERPVIDVTSPPQGMDQLSDRVHDHAPYYEQDHPNQKIDLFLEFGERMGCLCRSPRKDGTQQEHD
jgi:hypothetical protein